MATQPTITDGSCRTGAAPARHIRAGCILLLFALPSIAIAAGGSALIQLAGSLVDAPTPLRVDLAQAALDELSAAYAQEAQRARSDLRRNPGNRDLRRWADAIDRLAAEQAGLAASLTLTTPVDISIGPDHDLHLNIAGKPVVVAGPRPNEQAALERRILERYCSLNLCDPDAFNTATTGDETQARTGRSNAAPLIPDTGNTRWSFSPAGPSCIAEGLEFQFNNADSLRQKRRLCAQVAAELQQLAAQLTDQAARGIGIDWNALRIQPTADAGLQSVRLNAGGTTIELNLPTLNALPELFEMIRPWLAGKVRGETYHLVVINTERLMAPLLPTP